MNCEAIKTELKKFNKAQRNALRSRFPGRKITFLNFDQKIDFVTVQFGHSQHQFYLGPRGGIRHHKVMHAGFWVNG